MYLFQEINRQFSSSGWKCFEEIHKKKPKLVAVKIHYGT